MKITNIKRYTDGDIIISGHIDYYGFHCYGQIVKCSPEERDQYKDNPKGWAIIGPIDYKFEAKVKGYGKLKVLMSNSLNIQDKYINRNIIV